MRNRIFKAIATYKELFEKYNPDSNVYTLTDLLGNHLKGYLPSEYKDDSKCYQIIHFCGIEVNPNTQQVKIEINELDFDNYKPVAVDLKKWTEKLEATLIKYDPDKRGELIKLYTQSDFLVDIEARQGINPDSLSLEEYRTKASILDNLLSRNVNFNK